MVLISYFKSMNGKVTEIESCEPGCWIRCIAPTNDEINSLIAEFAIEPDFFRAAMDEEESSHIDIEDESTLLIVDIPVLDRPHEKITYSTIPLGIIITQSNVITVSTKESPILSEIADGAVKDIQTNLKTRFILNILLRVATRYLQYLRQIDKIFNQLEKKLRKTMKNNELIKLLDIEKSLVYFSSSLKANEITIEKIMRGRVIKMYEEDQDLIEDVLVEIRQAIDMSSIYLNILSGTMDAFSSIISNNLNIVMKVLASLTLLTSIPTVVSGIYGMNVDHLPVPFFWFPVMLSIVCMVVAFIILKKKDML